MSSDRNSTRYFLCSYTFGCSGRLPLVTLAQKSWRIRKVIKYRTHPIVWFETCLYLLRQSSETRSWVILEGCLHTSWTDMPVFFCEKMRFRIPCSLVFSNHQIPHKAAIVDYMIWNVKWLEKTLSKKSQDQYARCIQIFVSSTFGMGCKCETYLP